MFTAIVIADKLYSDHGWTNSQYARIGGYKIEDFNRLERDFLSLIAYNLNVTAEQYETYHHKMVELAHKFNINTINM